MGGTGSSQVLRREFLGTSLVAQWSGLHTPNVGKSFRMCCLSQQCPAARPCIGFCFSFFKLWTRIPTCPLRALNSDHPESINPCDLRKVWGFVCLEKNF